MGYLRRRSTKSFWTISYSSLVSVLPLAPLVEKVVAFSCYYHHTFVCLLVLPFFISLMLVLNHVHALFVADSTVLAFVLSELNRRHNYGLDLFLLSIDEGISGYRDDSLETVKRNEIQVCNFLFFFFF